MRIELTLDNDVADALRNRARLLGVPLEQVVNETLRRGLSREIDEPSTPQYRIVPNRSGLVPNVDPLKLKQINDEIEAQCFHR